jgi:hypothetical protein
LGGADFLDEALGGNRVATTDPPNAANADAPPEAEIGGLAGETPTSRKQPKRRKQLIMVRSLVRIHPELLERSLAYVVLLVPDRRGPEFSRVDELGHDA